MPASILNGGVLVKHTAVSMKLSNKAGVSVIVASDSSPEGFDTGGEDRPDRLRDGWVGQDSNDNLGASGRPIVAPPDLDPRSSELEQLFRVWSGPEDGGEHLRQGSAVDRYVPHSSRSRSVIAQFHSVQGNNGALVGKRVALARFGGKNSLTNESFASTYGDRVVPGSEAVDDIGGAVVGDEGRCLLEIVAVASSPIDLSDKVDSLADFFGVTPQSAVVDDSRNFDIRVTELHFDHLHANIQEGDQHRERIPLAQPIALPDGIAVPPLDFEVPHGALAQGDDEIDKT